METQKINNFSEFYLDHAILAESLHLSIPAHQNRLIASNREPTTFNQLSTLHSIGSLLYILHLVEEK